MSERDKYFEWIYTKVCSGRFARANSYRKLIECLSEIDYFWIIPDDANRAEDGEEGLRWHYMYENHISPDVDLSGPCSVLEMILALAFKCEEIMDDAIIGDRTGQWFWHMINNLGLGGMSDRRFDREYVLDTIDRFLNRDFESDGHGSLFIVRNCKEDLRDIPIWTSMLWYLDQIT